MKEGSVLGRPLGWVTTRSDAAINLRTRLSNLLLKNCFMPSNERENTWFLQLWEYLDSDDSGRQAQKLVRRRMEHKYMGKVLMSFYPSRTVTMIRENRQLVTNEPVEFELSPVEVQDCRKITDRFRGFYRIYPNFMKEIRRMSTCNRFDLQTLGSQPVMPKNLPDHWTVIIYPSLPHPCGLVPWPGIMSSILSGPLK